MGVWKDYGKVEKEVFPESLRDRNLTACVSRFHIGESFEAANAAPVCAHWTWKPRFAARTMR